MWPQSEQTGSDCSHSSWTRYHWGMQIQAVCEITPAYSYPLNEKLPTALFSFNHHLGLSSSIKDHVIVTCLALWIRKQDRDMWPQWDGTPGDMHRVTDAAARLQHFHLTTKTTCIYGKCSAAYQKQSPSRLSDLKTHTYLRRHAGHVQAGVKRKQIDGWLVAKKEEESQMRNSKHNCRVKMQNVIAQQLVARTRIHYRPSNNRDLK